MNIDQVITSYTYARVSGSSVPLSHIDKEAKKIISSTSKETQSTLNKIFCVSEYEQRLRYIRNENINRKS